LAYYGDDFTGACDVMEVLQWFGLRTLLFLEPPAPQQLDRFDGLRAIGVAGSSRAMSPQEMEAVLPGVFRSLRDSGAPVVHYKTCSTFDSSPEIGSIGKALELGRDVFGRHVVPILVAAPDLGRYQVFGNLFARSGLDSEAYRLDRHPTMRHHPITPMAEADLREVLATQTDLRVGLVDVLRLAKEPREDEPDPLHADDVDAVLFDVLYREHLPRIGGMIDRLSQRHAPALVVGSSGVEYALTEFWSATGRIHSLRTCPSGSPAFGPVEQLLVVTGSCSPVNDRQITAAERNGTFYAIPITAARLVDGRTSDEEVTRVAERVVDRLRAGANIILHTSRGPQDPRIAETHAALRALGLSDRDIKLQSGRLIGPQLGKLLGRILAEWPLRRVGVAGGDSSGYIARELGIVALEAIAPVAPGSPLCRVYAENSLDGVEFLFKGGQVGKNDVWQTVLRGTRPGSAATK
jgi:uncharacterized protein YgbK (DUF1537 family)